VNFTGAKVKKSRALGVALTPKAERIMRKRAQPQGQRGANAPRRRRKSDYGQQLLEKQRLRFQYNVSESYLQRTFQMAAKIAGPTGDNLVALLESRADAIVLRAGLAPTIYAARQAVSHGHFLINGRRTTIASQRLKPGDVISVRPRSRNSVLFQGEKSSLPAAYLQIEDEGFAARLSYTPPREEVPVICDVHLVVEYYSR
jgi:small subunit ribosomal protein S4